MEKRRIEITSRKYDGIKIGLIPGHFATNHSHVNFYVDMNSLKKYFKTAKLAAKALAAEYINTPVDSIICLEGTQVIGAFLAEQLSEATHSLNDGNDVCILTPELNSANKMIFRDDTQGMVWHKKVLLLISSVSTGRTIENCIECLAYYSGELVGVAALFSAIENVNEMPVKSIFDKDDLPDYETCSPAECALCERKERVDAVINDHGYSRI